MYAVIATGGKQYKIVQGEILRIEKLAANEGDQVQFDQVLMIADGNKINIGKPYIDGGTVSAKVNSMGRGKKIEIIKFKRRKKYRKKQGHRQDYTEVEITSIAIGKEVISKPAAKAATKPAVKKAEKKAPAPTPAKTEKPATKAKTETKPAALFLDKPNGTADDLKKISGVGPVLEGKLNDLGIYHFSQIAAFSADDIAMVDDKLNFKGRIDRDDWLTQAKELDASK